MSVIDFFVIVLYNNNVMKPYEHIQKFKVKYCEVDFKDELKLSTALSFMEEVACSSADELGFGYEYVKNKNCAFMVTNIRCEFLSPLRLGENITVKTWPLIPSFVIFGREYRFFDEDGNNAINASSRWCLVDVNTGKLLQSSVIDNQDYTKYNDAKALENVQWKIPKFDVAEGELRFTLTVANSEYDHNMHVNNTRYADYCLNVFSVDELKERSLSAFSIAYVKQCKEGDVLRFYRKELSEREYLVQGVNGNNEIVVQAKVSF